MQSARWEDTKSSPIEDRLIEIVQYISAASQRALERATANRQAAEEARRRHEDKQRIFTLREGYETWETALAVVTAAWTEHRAQAAFVESLRRHMENEALSPNAPQLRTFLSWAEDHLATVDPTTHFEGVAGDPPQWSHKQRAAAGRLDSHPMSDYLRY